MTLSVKQKDQPGPLWHLLMPTENEMQCYMHYQNDVDSIAYDEDPRKKVEALTLAAHKVYSDAVHHLQVGSLPLLKH